MRHALGQIALLLGSILVSVAAFECGLRLYYTGNLQGLSGEHSLRSPHKIRGWTLEPNGQSFQGTRDYGVIVRTNSLGMRDRPHDLVPEPGIFRILILGDSFMEAYQVPLEDSLSYLLQERLASRRVEVLNLGVGGYGTAQELLALEGEGLRYRPSLVVLAFYVGNDVHNNSHAIEATVGGEERATTYLRPYAHASALDSQINWIFPDPVRLESEMRRYQQRKNSSVDNLRRALQPAMVANVVERAAGAVLRGVSGARSFDPNYLLGWPFLRKVTNPEVSRLWAEAWLVTRRLLLEIDQVSRAAGARFVVLIVPMSIQVDARELDGTRQAYPDVDFDVLRINRELNRFCSDFEIPLLDPTSTFARTIAAGHPLYHRLDDRHWNSAGHALAAELLAQFLEDRNLVPAAQ